MSKTDGTKLKNIKIGGYVSIAKKGDRSDVNLISGNVAEILTRSEQHPHGIMVRLETGEIGRVKECGIITSQNGKEPGSASHKAKQPKERSLRITENETGHTYMSLFGDYLMGATSVELQDPYIRLEYQIKNVLEFCTVLHELKSVKCLNLITSYNDEQSKEKIESKLRDMQNSLKETNIDFSFRFDSTIHSRHIESDTGWRIIPDRGLDIYKDPGSYYSIAQNNQSLRKCKKTVIDYIRI